MLLLRIALLPFFFNAIQNTYLLNDGENNFDGKNYQWKYFSQFSLSCDPESQLYLSSCLPVCTDKWRDPAWTEVQGST